MILHDRIVGLIPTEGQHGYPGPPIEVGPFPAHVRPLRSSEAITHGGPVETAFYRATIDATADPRLSSAARVRWRAREYQVEGDVEPHRMLNGRLHHYEATLRRV